jgi:hypothetical protein
MPLHHDGVLRSGTRLIGPREALRLDRGGGRLTVLGGSIWLTRSHDASDYLVDRAESFSVAPGDEVVIEVASTGQEAIVHWQAQHPPGPAPRHAALRMVAVFLFCLLAASVSVWAADRSEGGGAGHRARIRPGRTTPRCGAPGPSTAPRRR